MMLKMNKRNEQGFTFVEILTCLAIVALIVGPICFSFLSSLKTRVTAESINEATAYAERMLEDIKVQITDDIILRQKIVGNRVATSSYSGNLSIDTNGVCDYLIDLPSSASVRSGTQMTNFFKGADSNILNSRYDTDTYAYEVALWRMNDIPFASASTTKTFTLDENAIGKAVKLFTDSSADYQFKASKYTGLTNPITFKITDEMIKAFEDQALAYVPSQESTESAKKVMDKNTITLNTNINTVAPATANIKNWRESTGVGNKAIEINQIKTIKNASNVTVGYIFEISNGTDSGSFTATNSRSIIELDIRALLRDTNLVELTTYDTLTFKFVNNTVFDQFIVVKQNAIGTETTDINTKFNIVAEDKSTGKSGIVRIDDIDAYENYLITVIVREKNPVLGESGKIVKKLIDIFSYDVTANKRR